MQNRTATIAEFAEKSSSHARLQVQQSIREEVAQARKINPDAWKGWTMEAIMMAKRGQNFTRDEDGEIWA